MKDIKHLVEQLRLRDERISYFELDLRRLTDDFRRLREDMLPALRLAKDAHQPLPTTASNGPSYPETISPVVPTPSTANSNLKRQFSTKKIVLSQPKTASPTTLTHDRMLIEQTLDPASAAERAVLSSSQLSGGQHLGPNGNSSTAIATSPSYPPMNMPSPTSPPTTGSGTTTTLASRSYRADQATPSSRSTFADSDHYNSREKPVAPRRMQTPAAPPDTPSSASNASVEIFKSFRVSMDDPCYKVLPAALKKYQINAPWDQYALYIVYGDQERCLGLDEKPLILFKQLDREGKKPMFMLRKTNNAQVDLTADVPGSAGLSAAARGATTGYDPPGGII